MLLHRRVEWPSKSCGINVGFLARCLVDDPRRKLKLSWSAVFLYAALYIWERVVDYRICRIREVTFLIDGTHGRIREQ